MTRKPRPRDASIMTRGLLTTAGLVGLFMAVTTSALISYGTTHYGSLAIGSSMGVTAFSLMIIVAAFQARSVTASALAIDDVRQPEPELDGRRRVVLAVLITQTTLFNRLLDTTPLKFGQFGVALASAVALLVLWEAR